MLCLTILKPSVEAILKVVKANLSDMQLFEIRADVLKDPLKDQEGLKGLFRFFPKLHFILTLRSQEEGGFSDLSPLKRELFFKPFLETKELIVDLELKKDRAILSSKRKHLAKTLASFHGEEKEAKTLLNEKKQPFANFFKWAVEFRSSLSALTMAESLSSSKTICISLNPQHGFLRVLYKHYKMPWMYTYDESESMGHLSQLSLQKLRRYQIPRINLETKYFALIGDPIGKSYSDLSHNHFFKKNNINARYLKIPLKKDECKSFLNYCKKTSLFQGFSVTMPLKEFASKEADIIEKELWNVGAINTLVLSTENPKGNIFKATNTDGEAVLDALKKHTIKKRVKVLILGAGGAAKAICHTLKKASYEIWVVNRTGEKLSFFQNTYHVQVDLLNNLKNLFSKEIFDVVINATSVGMLEEESLLDLEDIDPKILYLDVVGNPRWTLMLKLAKKKGCRVITGKEMFFRQAFKQWLFFKNNFN
jgi:shikimate dehydrogenase